MDFFDFDDDSDIESFADSLSERVMDTAQSALSRMIFAYTCPNCGTKLQLHYGENACPQFNQIIDLKLEQ